MTENHNRKTEVRANLAFAAPYWHDLWGVSYSQQFLSDPSHYSSFSQACHQHMEKKQQKLKGSSYKPIPYKPEPFVSGYVTTTLPMMLGCNVHFQNSEYPYAEPLELSDEEIMALEDITDFSDNPVMCDLEEQASWLKQKYGHAKIRINMQSVVNVAFKLRGDQLMFDFFEKPEIAHKLIDYTQQTWVNIRSWIDKLNRKYGMPSDKDMISLDNCNAALLSPQIYHDFFLPYDLKTAALYSDRLGIHHCGDNMEKFAVDYASLGKAIWYDIGYGSDVKSCISTYSIAEVEQVFSVRFGPAVFRSMDPSDITHELDQLAQAGASYILCLGVDPETPEENLKAYWQWKL